MNEWQVRPIFLNMEYVPKDEAKVHSRITRDDVNPFVTAELCSGDITVDDTSVIEWDNSFSQES